MRHLILALVMLATPAVTDEIDLTAIASLPKVDVVFLGELHDNPWHHEKQAEIVKALAPSAIVFEMLTPDQAGQITPDMLSDKNMLESTLGWKDSGWPDFSMYYPIFSAGKQAVIFGAQVPRAQVRDAIMGEDFATSFGDDAARYGLTDPLKEAEQLQREAQQQEAHCNALPEEMLPGMVLGQRLRDATLAREIERALAQTGGPVAVITGNGHARTDWGAPHLLSGSISYLSIAQFEAAPEDEQPFHHWIVSPEASREDPCLAFRKD